MKSSSPCLGVRAAVAGRHGQGGPSQQHARRRSRRRRPLFSRAPGCPLRIGVGRVRPVCWALGSPSWADSWRSSHYSRGFPDTHRWNRQRRACSSADRTTAARTRARRGWVATRSRPVLTPASPSPHGRRSAWRCRRSRCPDKQSLRARGARSRSTEVAGDDRRRRHVASESTSGKACATSWSSCSLLQPLRNSRGSERIAMLACEPPASSRLLVEFNKLLELRDALLKHGRKGALKSLIGLH